MTQPKPNTMDDWSRSDIKHLLMCFKYPDQYPEISLEDAIALIQTKLEEVDRAAYQKGYGDGVVAHAKAHKETLDKMNPINSLKGGDV